MNTDSNTFVSTLPPQHQPLARKIIKTLKDVNPDYTVKKAWGGLGFKIGKNYSCLLAGYKNHLKLMIWRGTKLTDPLKKLEGTGTNTRHIKYFIASDVDTSYLSHLLKKQKDLYDSGMSYEGR